MAIQLICACGKGLKVPDAAAGKRAKCPACGKVQVVPSPAMANAPAPARPAPAATPEAGEKETPPVMVHFSCECGTALQALVQYAGRDTRCPRCGTVRPIPAADEEATNGLEAEMAGRRLRRDPPHAESSTPLDVVVVVEEDAEVEPEGDGPLVWPWVTGGLLVLLLIAGGVAAWWIWLRD